MQNKLKVAWICHFTNAEIQSLIPIWKQKNEFASWIPNMLKGFEIRDDIELHVISPHEYLKNSISFALRRIQYHFIPSGMPIIHRHWPVFFRFDLWTNFYFFRNKVRKTISKINPDIINLIGAENRYYSPCIFDFINTIPTLITIQGFISQLKEEYRLNPEIKYRIAIEERILKSYKYFCGEQDSSTYINYYNPHHVFFRLYFPVNEALVRNTINEDKKYDCIYFGKISKIKGTEDFIKAIAEIKTVKPEIKAIIVGGGNPEPFVTLAKELHCFHNIEFKGFVKSQRELFEYINVSRVFLVPPYKERLSSTIREAMFLKIPIVAYATGGIPYINEFGENIYLVKTGDYKAMAEKALVLLNNEEKRNSLVDKAYEFAKNEFSLAVNIQRHIDAYKSIMKNKNEQIQ